MSREEEYKMLWGKIRGYQDGTLKSNQYTESELAEKRKYFESCLPDEKLGISKHRWMGEIKRVFEFRKDFKSCPDAGLTRLEYILKFGL